MPQRSFAIAACVFAIQLSSPGLQAWAAEPLPSWAYPVSKPPPPLAELPDAQLPQSVPGSDVHYSKAQLRNLYQAPDWRPQEHPAMPAIVASGRNPGVFACAYCHQPDGVGRPENASLAGLTPAYIAQQMADYRAGLRKSSEPALLPQTMMAASGKAATDAEVEAAAAYFAALPPRPSVKVFETDTVPQTEARGWRLAPLASGEREPIGRRIVELAEDAARTDLRDPASGFIAYVPLGAVRSGQALAASTARGAACISCHGAELRGIADTPRLAGRSPSYLVRQLIDFQSGARAGALSAPMREAAKSLSMDDIISLAAYAASLPP